MSRYRLPKLLFLHFTVKKLNSFNAELSQNTRIALFIASENFKKL